MVQVDPEKAGTNGTTAGQHYKNFAGKFYNNRLSAAKIQATNNLRAPALFIIGLYFGLVLFDDRKKESQYLKEMKEQFYREK